MKLNDPCVQRIIREKTARRAAHPNRLTIGLSINQFDSLQPQNLFKNGLNQHAFMLAELMSTLELSADLELRVCFLSSGKAHKNPEVVRPPSGGRFANAWCTGATQSTFRILDMNSMITFAAVDIIIVLGRHISHTGGEIASLINLPVVHAVLGNDFMLDLEAMVSRETKPTLSTMMVATDSYRGKNKTRAKWVSDHFEYSSWYLDYCSFAPPGDHTKLMPYFWAPRFLHVSTDDLLPLVPGDLRLGCFESNYSSGKNCVFPTILMKKAEEHVSQSHVYGCSGLFKRKWWSSFARRASLKTSFHPRAVFQGAVCRQVNCVISYTHDWGLNYLHLECFKLGVPIIHCAPEFKQYGFYYERGDIEAAQAHVVRLSTRKFDREAYKRANQGALDRYSVEGSGIKKFLQRELRELANEALSEELNPSTASVSCYLVACASNANNEEQEWIRDGILQNRMTKAVDSVRAAFHEPHMGAPILVVGGSSATVPAAYLRSPRVWHLDDDIFSRFPFLKPCPPAAPPAENDGAWVALTAAAQASGCFRECDDADVVAVYAEDRVPANIPLVVVETAAAARCAMQHSATTAIVAVAPDAQAFARELVGIPAQGMKPPFLVASSYQKAKQAVDLLREREAARHVSTEAVAEWWQRLQITWGSVVFTRRPGVDPATTRLPKWYYINLDASHARNAACLSFFERHRAQVERFQRVSGVDGRIRDLTTVVDFSSNQTSPVCALKPTEAACLLSHLTALQAFVHDPENPTDKFAIIAEDDVDINDELTFSRLTDHLEELPSGWGIYQMGIGFTHTLPKQNNNNKIVPWRHGLFGTFAYAITRDCAAALLEYLLTAENTVRFPPDALGHEKQVADTLLYSSALKMGWKVLTRFPSIATVDFKHESIIGNSNVIMNQFKQAMNKKVVKEEGFIKKE